MPVSFNGPFGAVAAEAVLPLPPPVAIARVLSGAGCAPAARPQPRQAQMYRTHVGTGGTVTVSRPGATGSPSDDPD